MLRSTIFGLFAAISLAGSVLACESVDDDRTPQQFTDDAISSFKDSKIIYEGILLGFHDYTRGGRFLVLKTYKGPAQPFEIVKLAGGTSCYGGVRAFSIGFVADLDMPGFDGFVGDRTVEIWRDEGLIDSAWIAPSRLAYMAELLIVACPLLGAFWLLRRRKSVQL